MKYLGTANLAEARQLPSSALILANSKHVAQDSPYGGFTYGPTVDSNIVPALPSQLLQQGQFDGNINVMAAHNTDEGLYFTNPYIVNNTGYEASLVDILVTVPPDVVQFISQTLYPPIYNGSQGYTSDFTRSALTIGEAIFACNIHYLGRAFGNRTHNYLFSVPPALHATDVGYTFYNGPIATTATTMATKIATAAVTLQKFITNFVLSGNPGLLPSGLAFPEYGAEAAVAQIALDGVTITKEPAANPRCEWWGKAMYF